MEKKQLIVFLSLADWQSGRVALSFWSKIYIEDL